MVLNRLELEEFEPELEPELELPLVIEYGSGFVILKLLLLPVMCKDCD